MANWKNKIVVVTGGSEGLGKTIGIEFASQGAQTILLARSEEKLIAAVESAGSTGSLFENAIDYVVADVTRDSEVEAAVAQIISKYQRIDVWVNNVGKSTRARFEDCGVEEYKSLLEINFYSAVRCTLAVMSHLSASSGQVINIGSLASKTGWPNVAPYSVSKHALSAFCHQMRLEGPANVNCLHVCTGPIKRDDAGVRYQQEAGKMDDAAQQPGAGVKLKGLDPQWLAAKIVRACEKRKKELVVPFYSKILFAITQLSPALGDFILRRSSKKS